MSDSRDLFGKIDALFEKRDPDALLDKGLEHEDFPVLTDVVRSQAEEDARAAALERRRQQRRNEERRLGDRRETGQPASSRPQASSDEMEALLSAMERRLADLFIRQQLRMEDAVRKVIREELDKAKSV